MSGPIFSRRTSRDRSVNALTRARDARAARGLATLDLTMSSPLGAGLGRPGEELTRPWAEPGGARAVGRYEPRPLGMPSAREAVARHLGVDPSSVVLTSSTSEAYSFLFKLLGDPGDEVLAPSPSYPLLDHLADLEAVRVARYRLAYDGAWHLDVSSLARAVTPRTRAAVVINPNNPTGSYVRAAELDALERLGLPLIVDEVFSPFALAERADIVQSALERRPAGLTFVLGGLSKWAALPQMKVGWIVVTGPGALVREATDRLELIADTFLSVATPQEVALPAWLDAAAAVRARIVARVRANLELVRRELLGAPVSVLDVEGGWSAILHLPSTQTDEAWALSLLEAHGVLVQPGYFYDLELDACVVVSLLPPEELLADGLGRVRRVAEAALVARAPRGERSG